MGGGRGKLSTWRQLGERAREQRSTSQARTVAAAGGGAAAGDGILCAGAVPPLSDAGARARVSRAVASAWEPPCVSHVVRRRLMAPVSPSRHPEDTPGSRRRRLPSPESGREGRGLHGLRRASARLTRCAAPPQPPGPAAAPPCPHP